MCLIIGGMDLFDLAYSVVDTGLWLVAFATAGLVAFGVWGWLRWGGPGPRAGWTAAAFVVSLVVMAGMVRPALEGPPAHPRHQPNSHYTR